VNATSKQTGSPFRIRPERPGDANAIASVTREAFLAASHGSDTEVAIVTALRDAGSLSVSLVAEVAGRVAGHIAFSPVNISDGARGWYGLGPLSVAPQSQRGGIGSALVREGIAALRRLGAHGCVVLGEPAFYGRFGFAHVPALRYAGAPPEYFLAQSFGSRLPTGEVAYHAAFGAAG
jgi:putative acetyltransferase